MWEVSLQHYLSRVYNTHNIHISHLRVLSTLVARELEIHNYADQPISDTISGAVLEKIKGNSFVGMAATPLKPLPSCYRVKRRGICM